ncbi:MAG: prolyl oligopeptidase family serine peptidase [Verrucomicrobiota bacterium]
MKGRWATLLGVALGLSLTVLHGAVLPPPGTPISDSDRSQLQTKLGELQSVISDLRKDPKSSEWLPDIEIFAKAVQYPLQYNEFYNLKSELPAARKLLEIGLERASQLRLNEHPWSRQTGLVVRAYRSKIDGSVQPFGLVIPNSVSTSFQTPRRLDIWLHGRDEHLTELNFINGRLKSPGEFTPENTIVLHLYGRYCNANKFAGEMDLFEALAAVQKEYAIDPNRILVRGFSMGGAACWHFAVHYAGEWAAAAPGAGFVDAEKYLHLDPDQVPWYEKKLWHWYNGPDYAINLFNTDLVAYSGEIDKQKAAADMMAEALSAEGLTMTHIIGPNTGHKYHPVAKQKLIRRLDQIAEKGRDPAPREVHFQTYTLRYNQMKWVTVDGLEEHWARARVDAEIESNEFVAIQTTNINALTLNFEAGYAPFETGAKPKIQVDGAMLRAPGVPTDRSWLVHLQKTGGKWEIAAHADAEGLRKVHGLQGPIDDAFMDSFVFVLPSGTSKNARLQSWVKAEQEHAQVQWRRIFRGDARVISDSELTPEIIADNNLVLWGDPQSNAVLQRILGQLPLQWNDEKVEIKGEQFSAADHVPVLIYPNPLNPKRYVVLNSGFTFREAHNSSNARQIAKLPDYAVIDLTQPPNDEAPGKVVAAGFFNESWH